MDCSVEPTDKLVDVFNKVWTLYEKINKSSEPSTSSSLQQSVKDALQYLSFLIESVKQLSLFSENEELDEVSTTDLRYFLLNALAASLHSKRHCDINTRPQILEESMNSFSTFLKVCLEYSIGNSKDINDVLQTECKDEKHSGKPDLVALNVARDAKIARFRRSKLQAREIQEMESKLHDEEISRKYWIVQIERWIDNAIEEMNSMRMELSMLKKFKDVPKANVEQKKPSQPGFKPFILTRDKLQAAVLGAGYPSLPTMTLEEYFDREVAAGRLPDQAKKPVSDNDHKSSHKDSDEDDDEKLKKQREFDDWKDTHRRGAGNRKNMG